MLYDINAIFACWVTLQVANKENMIYLTDIDPEIQKYTKDDVPPGMGVIYAIVHKTSRKAYIGATKRSARGRYNRHKNGSGNGEYVCPIIHAAIKKHGISSFDFVILCLCPREQLDREEVKFIAEHQTTQKEFGYNLAIGGGGVNGFPPEFYANIQEKRKITMSTDESKSKRSKSAKESWSNQSTRAVREERSEARMLSMVHEAEALAIPIPLPHLRKHGAIYIRNGKYYRFYVPVGRPVNRGNLKEISIEAIEAKRKESKERMAMLRAGV